MSYEEGACSGAPHVPSVIQSTKCCTELSQSEQPDSIDIYLSLNLLQSQDLTRSASHPYFAQSVQFKMPGFAQANELNAWQKLQEHHQHLGRNIILKEYFDQDPKRFEKFTRTFENKADNTEILFDFSKNFINDETFKLLIEMAKEAKVEQLRDDMFKGEKINFTEKRAVYHTALRNVMNHPMQVDGKSVVEGVNEVLDHMKEFSEEVRSGKWTGYSGKPIKTVINIGIGGSDL